MFRWNAWTSLTIVLAVAVGGSLAAVAEPPRVSIRVWPAVLFEGGAIRLRCWVEQDATNRYLEWGVTDYRQSRIELDGDKAAKNYEWTIERVPCDVGPPFCRLIRAGERDVLVTQPIQVSCRQGSSQR